MTTLHRLIWLTLLWAAALPATAADRLAVLELSGSAASAEVMEQLSDKLRSGALEAAQASDIGLEIMTRESMAAILDDMGIDAACVEGQCEVETARNLQAAYVISGSLVQVEGQYIVTTKLHGAASGTLLATEEAISASLLDLRVGVQRSGSLLLIKGLKLTPTSGSSQGAMGFGSISLGTDVESRLREQECDEAAKATGKTARASRLETAEANALDQAQQSWKTLEPELVKCTRLKRTKRNGCIDAVTQWLEVGRTMTVTVPAGVEVVQTDCGTREPAYPEATRTVTAADVPAAEAMLTQLKASAATASAKDTDEDHSNGTGVDKESSRAAERLAQSCDRGDADDCFHLGYMFANGDGVSKNSTRAANLYKKACTAGNSDGCFNAGLMFANGNGVTKHPRTAANLYAKACTGGDADGCFNAGFMFANGNGVTKNPRAAAELYTSACDKDHIDGCFNAGLIFAQDDRVKNAKLAAKLYGKACDGDNTKGCFNLGLMYANGDGVTQDASRAATLYTKACYGGVAVSCTNLGFMYAGGDGVTQDASRAASLFKKACDGGNQKACAEL